MQVTATPWGFHGVNNIPQIGTSSQDLLAVLPNVSEQFCLEVNNKNDINNPTDIPPQDPNTFDVTTIFTGSFSGASQIGTAATNANKLEGCLEGGGTPAAGTYHYYRVLLPR